jgi:serine/threonine protein kinase
VILLSDSQKRMNFSAPETSSFKNQSKSTILLEGIVLKKGRFFKTWRERHLVLYSNGDLCYYKSSQKENRKGYLKITYNANIKKAKRNGKFYFIVLGEERNLFVKASDKDNREKWYIVISNLINSLKEETLSITGKSFAKSIDIYYKPPEESMTWKDAILGSGTYGVVWKARSRETNDMYAIKSITIICRNRNKKKLRKEIDLLRIFNHPNIVRLYDVVETVHNLYIIQELCHGGELFDAISNSGTGKFNEKDAASVMRDAILAIQYCHDRNICHRDLKPENFLLATPLLPQRDPRTDPFPTIKLADFGLGAGISATRSSHNQLSGLVGTIFYIAPEIFSGTYGLECDMWSLGVILYILLNGNFPFDGSNVKEVANKIRTVNLEFTSGDWSFVSNEAKSLVSNLLTRNKVERLTAQEALESRWIQMHANHKMSSVHGSNNSSLKESNGNRNESHSRYGGESEELTETYVNKRIANLTKRSKMEKILKNFLADSLTIELQEKFLQKCIDFDEDKGSSGYIKDKAFGFLVRDFYEENIESINSGQKFGNNDSFCIRKRSEMLKIFNRWDRLCCGQDKQSSVSHRFIDYFQFLNDCEGK